MARPIVALLTDFGTRDHYAGTLKGVVLERVPGRHARRHRPRHSRARRAGRRARARRVLSILSGRHDLPRRRRSGRRIVAPRHRRRHRRLPIRGARQRRAVGGVSRIAAEEGRRADRAKVCAADRQPHLRGTRSICAGRRLPRQGGRAGVARQEPQGLPDDRSAAAGGVRRRIDAARSCASIASAT